MRVKMPIMKESRFFTIRKTLLGGGLALVGIISVTGLGFSNFTLVKSSTDTGLKVSVGDEQVFRFNLADHVSTWSFTFPTYNPNYGFYNVNEKTFSPICTIKASVTLTLNDTGDFEHNFQSYYTNQLAPSNPTSLTFYSRLRSNSFDLTNLSSATVSYSYTTTTGSGQSNQTGSSAASTKSSSYIDNQIAIALPTQSALRFTNWDKITFVMTYGIDYSSLFSNYVVNDTTTFSSVCSKLVATTFTASLFLGESYVAIS